MKALKLATIAAIAALGLPLQSASAGHDATDRYFCRRHLPGIWTLFLGDEVVIHANGAIYRPSTGAEGRWTCFQRDVVFRWNTGAAHQLVMSDNGNHLTGTSRGLPITADRKSSGDEIQDGLSPFDPILF